MGPRAPVTAGCRTTRAGPLRRPGSLHFLSGGADRAVSFLARPAATREKVSRNVPSPLVFRGNWERGKRGETGRLGLCRPMVPSPSCLTVRTRNVNEISPAFVASRFPVPLPSKRGRISRSGVTRALDSVPGAREEEKRAGKSGASLPSVFPSDGIPAPLCGILRMSDGRCDPVREPC